MIQRKRQIYKEREKYTEKETKIQRKRQRYRERDTDTVPVILFMVRSHEQELVQQSCVHQWLGPVRLGHHVVHPAASMLKKTPCSA